jgi:hypothetical protein
MGHIRPAITDEHIKQINELLQDNPEWNRTRLSRELCKIWEWQSAGGQIKDISCRDMLRDLDKTGAIKLPPARTAPRTAGIGADKILHIAHKTDAVNAGLGELLPLRISIAESRQDIMG